MNINFVIGNFSKENLEDFVFTDQFSGLYDDIFIKILSVTFALVGYLSLPAVGLVIWFERSGEAGNFRTLINQLVSFTLDQVRQFCFPNFIAFKRSLFRLFFMC